MSKKVLIFTSIAGGGHVAIAQALEQYLDTLPHPPTVKTVNTSSEISSATYRVVGEYFVDFHHANWQASNSPTTATLLHQFNLSFSLSKITRAIKNFKPDLIIDTSPFTTIEVAIALEKLHLHLPHLVVIADPFTIHHTWTTYQKAAAYLVPTPEAKTILLQRHLPPKTVTLTGLPLRLSVFRPPVTQSQARAVLKLHPQKTTVFIGGSGEGHGQIYKITQTLVKHPLSSKSQFLVVTGKNKLAKKRLDTLAKKYPQLHPFGYTNLIDTLLIASDFVIGKPGPNILFESLMLKKPFIATHQPLNQELGNYHYIKRQHLGLVTHKPLHTVSAALQFLAQPSLLNQFTPGINRHYAAYRHTPKKTLKVITSYL